MSKAHNKLSGDKAHDQRIAIIEKRVDTSNGGAEFDARADLDMPPEEHAARLRGADLDTKRGSAEDADDRQILRGVHQESTHNKKRADG